MLSNEKSTEDIRRNVLYYIEHERKALKYVKNVYYVCTPSQSTTHACNNYSSFAMNVIRFVVGLYCLQWPVDQHHS